MKKRIVIIEPASQTAHVFSGHGTFPLMGPLFLGAILRQAGHEVRIINEDLLGRPIGPVELDADVACISALTPTADRAYEIARGHKAIRPSGLTIMGGVHPSFLPDEAKQFADYVVVGEGELVIADLVVNGKDQKVVQGPRVKDLDCLPIPELGMLVGATKVPRAPLLTSRGCPFNCNFCSVTKMFGHTYRMHSIERVIDEIRRVQHKNIFFYDDNFTASPARTKKLLEAMLRANIRLKWTAQTRVDVARDQELVALMARAGCTRLYIGLESVDDSALKCMNKHQSVDDIVFTIETLHRHGIAVHGMFILGTDEDKPGMAKAMVRFSRQHQIDSVQFMVLTPLPGTPLFDRLESEGRLLHHRWSYYDGMHVVFHPAIGTAGEVQKQMIQAFEDFYSITGAVTDGLNAMAEALRGLLSKKGRNRSVTAVLTKIGARRVIRRWLEANREYLRWLTSVGQKESINLVCG